MTADNRGVSRLLTKLATSVEEGRYYEAHQMYRTLYFRYCAQKRFPEIMKLMYEGSLSLLLHDQQTSGADLAMLMLEVLEKSNMQPHDDNLDKIARLFELMKGSLPERHQYLMRALKWSSEGSSSTFGHPELHKNLAQILWKEKDYACARYHFIRSNDGSGCAIMLIEFHLLKGYPSEVDLFLAQAVLQYLCLKKRMEASDVFRVYTDRHPKISEQREPPFLLPLLNFLWLLLSALDAGKVSQFTVLLEEYRPSLNRDPTYMEYLDKIGQLFFHLPPPRKQNSHGIFGNFFQELFDGLDDEHPNAATTSTTRQITPDELD